MVLKAEVLPGHLEEGWTRFRSLLCSLRTLLLAPHLVQTGDLRLHNLEQTQPTPDPGPLIHLWKPTISALALQGGTSSVKLAYLAAGLTTMFTEHVLCSGLCCALGEDWLRRGPREEKGGRHYPGE